MEYPLAVNAELVSNPVADVPRQERSRGASLVVLAGAVLAIACATPLIRLADSASALTVASGRVTVAALLLLAAAPRSLAVYARLPRREQGLVALAGIMLGGHFGVWITSLYLTSTASSVTLVALQPVFAAALGSMFLGDQVARRALLGIGVAVVGTAVVAGADWSFGGRALLGDALALMGAALAAGYFVIGRSLRVAMPLVPYLALVNLVAAFVLVGAALISGASFAGHSVAVYAAIAASAVVSSLIGHGLLNRAVRRAPAHLVTLAIVGEPVFATLLTWAVIGEQPPWTAAVGGAVILSGIAVGFRGPGRYMPRLPSLRSSPS
jgi:drug/metabolite transporter (DMT)-like permease